MKDPSSSPSKATSAVANPQYSKSSNKTSQNSPFLTNPSLNGKTLDNIKTSTVSDSTTKTPKDGASPFKSTPL